MSLDRFDRKILSALQADATVSMSSLGDAVGLSQSQTWRRVERLEADGFIVGKVAQLSRAKLGLAVQVFTQVKLNRHGERAAERFVATVEQYPEVIEIHTVLGNVDYLLRIVTTDLNSYGQMLSNRLSNLPMVQDVHSLISLSNDSDIRGLPLALAP